MPHVRGELASARREGVGRAGINALGRELQFALALQRILHRLEAAAMNGAGTKLR